MAENIFPANSPDVANAIEAGRKGDLAALDQPSFGGWSDAALLSFITKGKPVTAGDVATDVTKSTGRGLGDFAVGLAGLPGDVQTLGEAGLSKLTGTPQPQIP